MSDTCVICGDPLPKGKPNQETCSGKCRTRLWRRNKEVKRQERIAVQEELRKREKAKGRKPRPKPSPALSDEPKRKRGRPPKLASSNDG